MNRTLVIGDIHGGLKALEQVLERVVLRKTDKLIFLGDYVDGWSDAAATISRLITISREYDCVFIKGNHDELCYQWLISKKAYPMWLAQGGAETVESYRNFSEKEIRSHIAFFESLENYHLDPENRLYLHAGFTNPHGVTHEHFKEMFYWDRTLWEMVLSLDTNLKRTDLRYPKRLLHYEEIYIGHTPVTRLGETTPILAANVWNIDTGAAFKGPLTVFDTQTKEYWQSEPVYTFYPDENGRNRD